MTVAPLRSLPPSVPARFRLGRAVVLVERRPAASRPHGSAGTQPATRTAPYNGSAHKEQGTA